MKTVSEVIEGQLEGHGNLLWAEGVTVYTDSINFNMTVTVKL